MNVERLMRLIEVELLLNLELDLAHRVIDVVKVQKSHGIEEHEWFGDAMHRDICIFLGQQKFFTSKECKYYKLSTY